MEDAQSNTEFYGISIHDLMVMDRVNVAMWMTNFHYLNAREMSITMAIHEMAVSEIMIEDAVPFSVSEILQLLESRDTDRRSEDSAWTWKMVKTTFERMIERDHITRLADPDPRKKKKQYRVTDRFREIIREYYAQYAQTVHLMTARMQMRSAAAVFKEIAADNPDLVQHLNLTLGDEDE
jgi:DNA-binding MarR family transcriptional regulator